MPTALHEAASRNGALLALASGGSFYGEGQTRQSVGPTSIHLLARRNQSGDNATIRKCYSMRAVFFKQSTPFPCILRHARLKRSLIISR